MIQAIILFTVGLALLIKGGDWFVDGATGLAHRFHLPDIIVGANIFNLVLVSGASVALAPFEVPVGKLLLGQNASLVLDIPLMLGVMLLLTLPALISKKLHRWQGILLLCIYAAFCLFQFAV